MLCRLYNTRFQYASNIRKAAAVPLVLKRRIDKNCLLKKQPLQTPEVSAFQMEYIVRRYMLEAQQQSSIDIFEEKYKCNLCKKNTFYSVC